MRNGTIAKVCEDIGINRQQFNKYLSGVQLPHQETLEKIGRYFEIDPIELFQSQHHFASSIKKRVHSHTLLDFAELLDHFGFEPAHYRDVSLLKGRYFVYYPGLFEPDLIVRAVVVVFSHNGMRFFRRFTRLRTLDQLRSRHYAQGHHEGIVLQVDRNLCFIAKNANARGEVSLQAYHNELFASQNAMTGISMVMTPWDEYCSLRCTMTYVGPMSHFREALKQAKIGTMSKDTLPEFMWESVTQPMSTSLAQLRAFGIDDWIRRQEREKT